MLPRPAHLRPLLLLGVLALLGTSPALGATPSVRVLGIAQDGGLPHAACRCDRCEAARTDPARASGVSSLALIAPKAGKVYLMDAAPEITAQLNLLDDVRKPPMGKVDRSPIDGVLLTHAHMGHYLGLSYLGFEAVSTKGVPVWASERMGAFLRDNGPWSQLVSQKNIRLERATPETPFTLDGDLKVTPFLVPHRDEYTDTLGYRVDGPNRSLVYIPDTAPWRKWKAPLKDRLKGVDVALLDATFYSGDELPGRDLSRIGHPLVVDTMDLLQDRVKAGTLEVYFIHLNHSNPALAPDSAARKEIQKRGFHVARVGQDIPL
ncbi:MAG: MBL fold metallo-hydrolase [Myxococcota bacterium]|nr:MBL fold metallo-hydrolase [Myxococcota bacterium]